MAGTPVTGRSENLASSEVRQLRLQLNKVIDDLEALRAALATHTHDGVTAGGAASGAPTAATITGVDQAADLTAAKVNA